MFAERSGHAPADFLGQAPRSYARIDLGRGDAAVAEKRLQLAQREALVHEFCGVSIPYADA